MSDRLRVGGIVLCGGESDRMGWPKATLPFGSEMMLQRVVRLLAEVVQPIVVVAAHGQQLPELPSEITVKCDEREACGPLEGLRVGLRSLTGRTDAAYATSCDVPLLAQPVVRRMIAALDDHDVAVPVDGEFFHPLAACYRTRTVPVMERMLKQGRRRMADLFDSLCTCRVSVQELRHVDPELRTLMNLNTPSDYAQAMEFAGIPLALSLKRKLGL